MTETNKVDVKIYCAKLFKFSHEERKVGKKITVLLEKKV